MFRRLKPKAPKAPRRRRSWPVTAGGLLLLAEGIGLATLSPYNYPLDLSFRISPTNPLYYVLYRMLATSMYAFLALLALIITVEFLRMKRNAWGSAIILQGLVLLSALAQYFGSHPWYVYLQMIYGIYMVLYLHYHDVHAPFEQKPPTAPGEALHD